MSRGLEPEVYVIKMLEENLPSPVRGTPDTATLALLAQWDAEDATTDPDEIARRQRDVDELKQAMNKNRLESEGPSARKIFP